MKKNLLLFLAMVIVNIGFSQDATLVDLKKESEKTIKKDPKDTLQLTWKKGGTFNLNINQGSLNNWSAGGDKFSFSLNSYLNLYSFYKKDKKHYLKTFLDHVKN